jgi:hypothetical protein
MKPWTTLGLAIGLALLISAPARADRPVPFPADGLRLSSPSGRWELRQDEAGRFDFEDKETGRIVSGTSAPPAGAALISDRGSGFVFLDAWGRSGTGDVVRIFDAEGALQHRATLSDLFGDTSVFRQSVSSVLWRSDAWIDHEEQLLVLVGADSEGAGAAWPSGLGSFTMAPSPEPKPGASGPPKLPSTVCFELPTGERQQVPSEVLLRRADAVPQRASLYVQLAARAGGVDVIELHRQRLADPARSEDQRLAAAVALLRAGDHSGAGRVVVGARGAVSAGCKGAPGQALEVLADARIQGARGVLLKQAVVCPRQVRQGLTRLLELDPRQRRALWRSVTQRPRGERARSAIVAALAAGGGLPDATLFTRLFDGAGMELGLAIVRAWQRMGPVGLEPLRQALVRGSAQDMNIAMGLRRLGDPSLLAMLDLGMQRGNPRLLRELLHGVGQLRTEESVQELVRVLPDLSPDLRATAVLALIRARDLAVPHVLRLLRDPPEGVRRVVLLRFVRNQRVLAAGEALVELWTREVVDTETRVALVEAIIAVWPQGAGEILLGALGGEGDVARAVERGLAEALPRAREVALEAVRQGLGTGQLQRKLIGSGDDADAALLDGFSTASARGLSMPEGFGALLCSALPEGRSALMVQYLQVSKRHAVAEALRCLEGHSADFQGETLGAALVVESAQQRQLLAALTARPSLKATDGLVAALFRGARGKEGAALVEAAAALHDASGRAALPVLEAWFYAPALGNSMRAGSIINRLRRLGRVGERIIIAELARGGPREYGLAATFAHKGRGSPRAVDALIAALRRHPGDTWDDLPILRPILGALKWSVPSSQRPGVRGKAVQDPARWRRWADQRDGGP